MPRDLDLKRRLELAGLIVIEVDGWQGRGSTTFDPVGSVHHHTAGPARGFAPSLGTVINGRPDLPGPLCNVHGPREESLRVHLVAAGRANHAGRGGWRGHSGNSSVYGLEEEHTGTAAEGISALRVDRMARVHAAFALGRFTPDEVCQHWEWTTRKPDFVRALLDPDVFRRAVADHLRHITAPPPVKDHPLMALSDNEQRELLSAVRTLRDKVNALELRAIEAQTEAHDSRPAGEAAPGTVIGRILASCQRIESRLPPRTGG